MIILISNDDGIQSEGIIALEEALRPVGEIYHCRTRSRAEFHEPCTDPASAAARARSCAAASSRERDAQVTALSWL